MVLIGWSSGRRIFCCSLLCSSVRWSKRHTANISVLVNKRRKKLLRLFSDISIIHHRWRTVHSKAASLSRTIFHQLFTDTLSQVILLTYLRIYLLTPCSRVLLEKLIGSQLVKKFPALYGTQRFINTFKIARSLSISWATPIQSMPSHPTSWGSILILPSHLCLALPSGLFPSGFPQPKPSTHHYSHP